MAVDGAPAQKFYEALPSGMTSATATIRASVPPEQHVVTRNVVGLLRGSDPVLKNTYILVSAHYDHLGMKDTDEDIDRIYNGANDDGSGTVSVIELASALGSLELRPKRSIVFVAFFGEEEGLVGSKFYAAHPLVPIAKTIAQINLEQIGRTDDNDGPQVGTMALTGFEYSDLHKILEAAAEKTGVTLRNDPHGDDYFARSDNLSLAEKGVVAHTIGVAFTFPDYHETGDEWQKIDYANMAKIDRALATALLMIANNPAPPKWNEENPKASPYRHE
jgi:Zn-dependent M28 family amino/carboxypeptidase